MSISLNEHLEKLREKAHETQKKNGHFKRMGKASAEARRKKAAAERNTN